VLVRYFEFVSKVARVVQKEKHRRKNTRDLIGLRIDLRKYYKIRNNSDLAQKDRKGGLFQGPGKLVRP